MEICGSVKIVKYLLIGFNLIFVITGLGLLIAGALVLADVSQFGEFVEGKVYAPPILLIIIGSVVFFIAFLGCFGAMKESKLLLIAFAVSLLVLFIIQLSAGISAAIYRAELSESIKRALYASLKDTSIESKDSNAPLHYLQSTLECCGVQGPQDWLSEHSRDKAMPVSCCHPTREGAAPPNQAQCRTASPTEIYVYQRGCFDQLSRRMDDKSGVIVGVGVGLAVVEIIGIILAVWLAVTIKKNEEAKN